MKFSLMTYTIYPLFESGEMDLPGFLRFAAGEGFAAVDLFLEDFGRMRADGLQAGLAANGLKISSVICTADLAVSGDRAFEAEIKKTFAAVDTALAFSSTTVMVIAARPESVSGPPDKRRAAARMAEGLRQACRYAGAAGVDVTIEDFPSMTVPQCGAGEIEALLESVPGLKLTFDTGNMVVAGGDPLSDFLRFSPYVVDMHCKDWEYCRPGEGIACADGKHRRGGLHGRGLVDLESVLRAAAQRGYDGYLSFEYEGPLPRKQALRQGMAYLTGLLRDITEESAAVKNREEEHVSREF